MHRAFPCGEKSHTLGWMAFLQPDFHVAFTRGPRSLNKVLKPNLQKTLSSHCIYCPDSNYFFFFSLQFTDKLLLKSVSHYINGLKFHLLFLISKLNVSILNPKAGINKRYRRKVYTKNEKNKYSY